MSSAFQPLHSGRAVHRLYAELLTNGLGLFPCFGQVFQRPLAAQQLDPHALPEFLHRQELDQSHLPAPQHMGAAAGAAVRAGEGHDPHIPLQRLFAAVVNGVQLRAPVELNVDGVILLNVAVGLPFDLQQLFPRDVGVEVDGHDIRPHVEAHIVAAVPAADQP